MSRLSRIFNDFKVTPEDVPRIENTLFYDGPNHRQNNERFAVLMFFATLIATFGVIAGSTATVIGAMLIAPLMTPVLAVAAAVFLAEVQDVSRFSQARQLDAYAGLTPGQRESGTSVHGRPHLIKWGNVQLRTALYMPALSAYRWNPVIAALHQRMQERGKSRMTIVTACMRKLLHLCYGVLKTRKPFDPDHALQVSFST